MVVAGQQRIVKQTENEIEIENAEIQTTRQFSDILVIDKRKYPSALVTVEETGGINSARVQAMFCKEDREERPLKDDPCWRLAYWSLIPAGTGHFIPCLSQWKWLTVMAQDGYGPARVTARAKLSMEVPT